MAIRIGIAGFGSHALGRILPVIEADERLKLTAVWARSELSHALLRRRGYEGVTADFEQFLAMPVDVVYVSTPTGLHFAHTAAILEAGLHAWVEKPVATNLKEVRTLVNLAAVGGLMLTEAFMFPWHAQASAIWRVLKDGAIGNLRFITLTFCFPHLSPQNFRYAPELGGGAFLDHACYLIKALDIYAAGTWSVLGGCIDYAQFDVDVAGAALLRRNDGVNADLNWGFGNSYINEIQFVGERGRMLVESAFTKPASRTCNLILESGEGKRSTIEVVKENPYERMMDGFIRQYHKPEEWSDIRQDVLRHAERFFALQSSLKQC